MDRSKIAFVFLLIMMQNLTMIRSNELMNTECLFNKTSSFIHCNTSVGSEGCEAKMTGIAKSFKLYSIGEMHAVGGENPMAWFRIYPRKEDNTGWWYYQGAKNTNSKLLIHPKEKNSKSNEGFLVSDSICWAKLHEMIRTSKSFVTIKAEKSTKSLFSLFFNHETVKIIGTLKVVD